MLTTGTDTIVGTAGDDTFEATSTTMQAADVIIDQTAGDNDTLNMTLTAANNAATVNGVENINVTWNAFGTAIVKAANFSDATITVSSSKLGYLGNVQVDDAGANTVVAGSGAVGALDVNGGTASVVNAGAAKTVTVDGSGTAADNVSASVTAGAATTTIDVGSATAFIANTVVGGAATTSIEVNGTAGLTDSADITVVKDGTVSVQTAEVESVTLTANAGQKVTLADGSLIDALTVNSTGAVTLVAGSDELKKAAMAKGLTDATVGGLTIDLTSDAAADLSLVQGTFNLKNALQADTTFKSGANLTLGVNQNGAVEFLAAGTGTADVLNMAISVDQSTLDVIDGTNDVETLNIVANAAATETDEEVDLNYISAKKVVLSGESKVAIGDGTVSANDDFAGETLDASALAAALTFTESSTTAAAKTTVIGSATAKNTIVFATQTGETAYTGGEGDDTVTLAQTTGDSTVVLGNGKNTYSNTTLTDGTAVVLGGAGVDTITLTATDSGADTANVIIQTGEGADVVTLKLAGADEAASVDLGAGDDKITLNGMTSGALDLLAIDGGDGSDTIDLKGSDLSLGTVTFANVEVIHDSTGGGVVDASELNGKTYTIKGDGNVATLLDVTTATAGTYDFSSLVLDNSLSAGIGGLSITGNAGNDTITGTSGADTIDGNDGTDTIIGGLGADSITTGTGVDTIVITSADTGKTAATADNITGFTTTEDVLSLGVAGTAANFVAASADGGATDALGVAAAITAAELVFDGTVKYYFYDNTNAGADNGYLIVDADLDGTADDAVILIGATTSTFLVYGDIVA